MLVSPKKIKKYKLLRNRTINFETVQKTYGNIVLVPSTDKEAIYKTLSSKLFRPVQLMCMFTPRRIKPLNHKAVVIKQKDFYVDMRDKTNNRMKIGKTVINSYSGRNLYYDLYNPYTLNLDAYSDIFHDKLMLQKKMIEYFETQVSEVSDDPDYQEITIVFPLDKYIENMKRRIITTDPNGDIDPAILFLKSIRNGTFNSGSYKKVKLVIFYNPDANILVCFDPNDPALDKNLEGLLLKVYRLNNYNAKDGTELLADTDPDIDNGSLEDTTEVDEEDAIENKKEEIKDIVLQKVAKTLRAPDLTDFEAANKDEQELALSIDDKIDKYLNKDENLKKPFNDLVSTIEQDNDIKAKAVRYVESKKTSNQRIDTLAKNLDKETEIISSIQDLDDDGEDNDASKFQIDIPDIDDKIKESHLSSFDDEYNKKQMMTDLTNVVSGFSSSDYLPLSIDSFNLVDTSDDFNMKKTLSVKYKTDENKPLSFQVDIPDIIDKRYLYLNGNKKVIKKQIVRLPVVKTKPDRVEITTNLNKMTIERTNGKLSRKNEYLFKMMANIKNNPSIKVEYGSNSSTNSQYGYVNDFEYEEFADSVSSITTPKYYLNFNRKDMDEEISLLDIPEDFLGTTRTPFGFEKIVDDTYTALIYIEGGEVYKYDIKSKETVKLSDSMFNFLAETIFSFDLSHLPTIGKSFIFTRVKFLETTYPLFSVIGSLNGLTNIMQRYGVQYYKSEKQIRNNLGYVEVKFKDCYLYYKDDIKNTLLLNSLYLMNTTDYTYDQFDGDIPYTHYFMKILGNTIGVYTRNTLRINLNAEIDPITKDILKDMKLPTNIVDVLLYANTLLVGNQYKTQNDMTNYRIRSNELVPDILYKVVADAYRMYQLHRMNGRPVNLSIPKNSVIQKLQALPNCNDNSTLNPVLEIENIADATSKGFVGININEAYTLEMRSYDDSMIGFISGNSTPYSGQAGISRSLTYDPEIKTVRGYITNVDKNSLSATNLLSPSELLSAFTSAKADGPRQAMQVAQTKHTMPIISSSKQLFGSGMNKTMAYIISDDFCFKAKKDGKVTKIDDKNGLAFLLYDDGTEDAVDLSNKFSKNSNMGFYIRQKFNFVYKVGEHFKAGDVLAYNSSYFSGKGKNVDYMPGYLAKVAVAPGDFSFEDSTLITENLSEKCAAHIDMLSQVSLGKNAVVKHIMEIGDSVVTNDHLIDFTSSFNDPQTSVFLANLAKQIGADNTALISDDAKKSNFSGTITNIDIYYNCPFEELSPSLQSLVRKFKNRINERKQALGNVKADNVHIPPLEQVNATKIGKKDFDPDGGVIINFYVEYTPKLGCGDKITYSTALKGVVSHVLKNEEAPLSEYRSEEPIDGVLTPTGIISRMTADIYSLLFINKVLVEVGKQVNEIWHDKR